MDGEIFANTVAWFKKVEADSERGDEYEGAALLDLPDMSMTLMPTHPISGLAFDKLHIPRKDMAGPLVFPTPQFDRLNMFCMYAKRVGEAERERIAEGRFNPLLEIPPSLRKFGRHAVLINRPKSFMERVRAVARSNGNELLEGSVEYYDPTKDVPTIPPDLRSLFRKRLKYAPQSEYRIVFDRTLYSDEPLKLNIGKLNGLAHRVEFRGEIAHS